MNRFIRTNKKKALVCGAGGFIGGHLVQRLKADGFWVRGVDIKKHEYLKSQSDDFKLGDLTDPQFCNEIFDAKFDEVYQLAADMGGAGYIFTGKNDARVMHNSALINLNIANFAIKSQSQKLFFSSSACVYPKQIQLHTTNIGLREGDAYPANPDSEYGWEKIFSERLYLSYSRNYGLDVRIARFHNVYGPYGSWNNGKEKSPAAICRKVAQAENGSLIEIWGDGKQTRSFLYIDECLEGIRKLMDCNSFTGPVNIGSSERVSINELADLIIKISSKKLTIKYIDGPMGVRGRSSDNHLIINKLGWSPSGKLFDGLLPTYKWIEEQVLKAFHLDVDLE